MGSLAKLKDAIEETILEYNRYRSSEVEAKLILIKDNIIEMEFRGTFCYTCGFYDYFEDHGIMLEEKGIYAKMEDILEIEDGGIVRFRVMDEITQRDEKGEVSGESI